MVTVKTPLPAIDVETTLPGSNRRRVWQAPDVTSHSLVAMTLVRLMLAPPGSTVKAETAKAIENGADLESVFGPFATTIDLTTIQRVKYELEENRLKLEYKAEARPGDGLLASPKRTIPVTIQFANHDQADAFYTKLWRRLGSDVVLQEHNHGSWELARVPVAIMAGVILMMAALGLGTNILADGSSPSGLKSILSGFDWRVICGVGGAVLAILQIWLYRRLTVPPTQLVLARTKPS